MKKDIKESKKHLQKARELAAIIPSALKGIPLEEAVKKMRKVREQLWEEKFAFRS